MAFENKDEALNKEGINEEKAKFSINRLSVSFVKPELVPSVTIEMRYEDSKKETGPQNSRYVWDEVFDL